MTTRCKAYRAIALRWIVLVSTLQGMLSTWVTCMNVPRGSGTVDTFLLAASWAHFFTLAMMVSLPWLVLLASRRLQGFFLFGVACTQGLLLLAVVVDAKVFLLYRMHINAVALNMLFGGAVGDNLGFTTHTWMQVTAYGSGVAVVASIMCIAAWKVGKMRHSVAAVRGIVTLGLMAMVATQVVAMSAYVRGDRRVIGGVARIAWAQPIVSSKLMRALHIGLPESGPAAPSVGPFLRYPRQSLTCDASAKPNIVMLVIESLRADIVDATIMPNVTAMASQSLSFLRHISSGNATRPGVFGLFYGLPAAYWPAMLGSHRSPVLVDEILRRGFTPNIYSSASLSSPEFDQTAFVAARDAIALAPRELDRSARDRWVTSSLVKHLGSKPDGPFFDVAFYYGTHSPYTVDADTPPPRQPMAAGIDIVALSGTTPVAPIFNRYLAAAFQVDGMIGEVLAAIDKAKLAENTIVIITGDHGEEFNDLGQGYWGHNGNFSDYQVHVPLLIRWPGRAPARITATTSHEDVAPTLLRHALGCNQDIADYSTGLDLFGELPPHRPVLVESWYNTAIRYDASTIVFEPTGRTTVLDEAYRPVQGGAFTADAVADAWQSLTRFRGGAEETTAP